ncbi:hypothetical protein [Halorhabdus sp. BNX81]|uniref:DUF7311 family protein n=1 Tax=Halorhabdus sp. BNX81 TaxID=2980181 RepID=UPI0023DD656B|nr:hypothetical protein [Halorhabdus sp. BNX81]WEL21585.1 Putative pilin/flagellin [Halorhabdus sp. BNX81]
MIRYVLAIILTTALLGIGVAGVDHAATVRSEQQVENQIAKLETAAMSLLETEEPTPRGQKGPRRIVELDLPSAGFASKTVDTFRIRPDPRGVSIIEYRVDERMTRTEHVEATIRNTDSSNGMTAFGDHTGTVTVALSLSQASDSPDNDREVYIALRVVSRNE